MTASPNAVASMRLLSVRRVGAVKLRRVADLASRQAMTLANAVEDKTLLSQLLSDAQLEELDETAENCAAELESLASDEVEILSVFDEVYPSTLRSRLGDASPVLLFARGSLDILESRAVGFCGSRKASEKGLSVAADCADQLGRASINVVSGYAAGVDLQAHRAALVAGGTTTLVLAEGIRDFRIKRELRDAWDWSRACVLSEFLPSAKWSVGNAMQRNRTICGLSNAMILIEARSTGGSIAAGNECMKLGVPLFAPVYQGMPESATGNRILLGRGARELRKGRQTNRAVLDELIATVDEPDPETTGTTSDKPQMSMFGSR